MALICFLFNQEGALVFDQIRNIFVDFFRIIWLINNVRTILKENILGVKMGKNVTRIFVVDDHPIVRDGLQLLLNREEGIEVCGLAENANNAI